MLPSTSVTQMILPPAQVPLSEVRDSALRRQINAELNEIRDQLHRFGHQDEMSQGIAHWHQSFVDAMRLNADAQHVLNEYIGLLQELLIDPISYTPLDEQALLGSDRRAYGRMSLCVFLNQVPPACRQRCPFSLEDSTSFTVRPHDLVRHMTQWLKNHGALLRSSDLEETYRRADKSVLSAIEIPSLVDPTFSNRNLDERRRRIIERLALREEHRDQQMREFSEQLSGTVRELNETIQNRFEAVHMQIQRNSEGQSARLDQIEQRDQRQFEALQQAQEQLEREIEEIARQNRELEEQIARVDIQIELAERDNLRLQIAINQAREAIEKRNKNWLGPVLVTLAILGGCAASTWILQNIGSSLAITPLEAGAKITATFPL